MGDGLGDAIYRRHPPVVNLMPQQPVAAPSRNSLPEDTFLVLLVRREASEVAVCNSGTHQLGAGSRPLGSHPTSRRHMDGRNIWSGYERPAVKCRLGAINMLFIRKK